MAALDISQLNNNERRGVDDLTGQRWQMGVWLDGVLFIDRIEKLEDLYRLSVNENRDLVRIQVSSDLK